MGKVDLDVRHAIIATKDRLPDRFLFADGADNTDGDFLFYIFEVDSAKSDFLDLKKSILTALADSANSYGAAEERFERLLEKINDALSKLIESGSRDWIGKLSGLIGIANNKKIFITQTGNAAGYIFRRGKISSLTDSSSGSDLHPKQIFSDIISGQLSDQDRLVFANSKLFDHVSIDHLRQTIENTSATEAIHNLYKGLRKMHVSSVNAVVIEAVELGAPKNSDDLAQTVYLDQVEETVLNKMGKFLGPRLKTGYELLGKESRVLGKAIKKNSADIYKKSQKQWEESLGPKTKKFLKENNAKVSKMLTPKQGADEAAESGSVPRGASRGKGFKAVYYRRESTAVTAAIDWIQKAWLTIFAIFRKKEARRYLYLALIIIFLVAGYAKIRYNNANRDKIKASQDASVAYDQAEEQFAKAKEDQALGRSVSLAVYESALDLAKQSLAIPGNKDRATALIQQIQTCVDSYTKMNRFYADKLKKISIGNNIQKIVSVGSDVYAFDADGKVYLSSPSDQSNRLVASVGKDKGNITNLKFDDSKNRVYILTSSGSVLALDTKTNTIGEASADGGWQTSAALATFAGNIYLLNSETGTIVKYAATATAYSAGSVYADAKKANMKGAIDIAIDGNIFVLQSDGSAIKFSRGAKDPQFTLTGIPGTKSTIVTPAKLFTSPESSYLYILDKKENRILRFDKTGSFSAQYTLDNMPVDDFGINDKIKKGWITSGNTVYEIDL